MTANFKKIILNLSNNSKIQFINFPLDQSSYAPPKYVDENLVDILLSPENYKCFKINQEKVEKIFLGWGSNNPETFERFPMWLPPDLLSSHLLIGGAIGSGKTTLIFRLIAGTLNTYGSVIIGEAKGGKQGSSEGAAFTNLAIYLQQKLEVSTYRWPRGDCWFNPLIYLQRQQDRDYFFLTVYEQINVGDGELSAYVKKAARIASLIVEWMLVTYSTLEAKKKYCTLRRLVKCLKDSGYLEKEIDNSIKHYSDQGNPNNICLKLKEIKQELEIESFFRLKDPKVRETLPMTSNGLTCLCSFLDQEDLLNYSEENKNLKELKIDDLLYQRSLVIISQPLSDPTSTIVGPLFWDALLSRIIDLGPNPPKQAGKAREKIAVFFDETHRLPTGKLGRSGDFLRQYKLGLVEITPAIVDKDKWEANKHVYQTIISLSPGIEEVIELNYTRLKNQPPDEFLPEFSFTPEFLPQISFRNSSTLGDYQNDNPGVSKRSLRETGQYTALLQSNLINPTGIFWIDLESQLLAKFDVLLHDAISEKDSPHSYRRKAVDYALGLVTEFKV